MSMSHVRVISMYGFVSIFIDSNIIRIINVLAFVNPNSIHLLFVLGRSI